MHQPDEGREGEERSGGALVLPDLPQRRRARPEPVSINFKAIHNQQYGNLKGRVIPFLLGS